MPTSPLAHSEPPDPYERHVKAVIEGAQQRASEAFRFCSKPPNGFLETVTAAATYHDLGKLDPDNQAGLEKGSSGKLPWDHIDAGVALLARMIEKKQSAAMWLIRGHHAPGLPAEMTHFHTERDRQLRGRRHDSKPDHEHQHQIDRTNTLLDSMTDLHHQFIPQVETVPTTAMHGLNLRIALSCLVDADHEDTARACSGYCRLEPAETRWKERLESLKAYVQDLAENSDAADADRNAERNMFFQNCLTSEIGEPMVSCEAPVGLGKTTSVMVYLLKQAVRHELRRVIVVAPFTNILVQTARTLRKALVLEREDPNSVIVEHHHRADFEALEDRELAVLWNAPIVLTTSVSFFETLSSCSPGALRKLHQVPGSAIILDESHAALPVHLWRQNWKWLNRLTNTWGCKIVLASGSLVKFWENEEIVEEVSTIPELLQSDQQPRLQEAERQRVQYRQLADGKAITPGELIRVVSESDGPRLVIINTVQSAAIVAKAMREVGMDVMHLSTALTPKDRARILDRVITRLKDNDENDWALVATSCVEAGVDISFRTGFRERFSTTSSLQTAGRVNRNGAWTSDGGSIVYDFALNASKEDGVTEHPACKFSAQILDRMLQQDLLNSTSPTKLATDAITEEIRLVPNADATALLSAESERNYPEVEKLGKVINADTRFVVIDPEIIHRITHRKKVRFDELLNGSVQLWASKINSLGILQSIDGRKDIYGWPENLAYDPELLGYMAGLLTYKEFMQSDAWIL